MDFVKRQYDVMQRQYAGLGSSQKMLTLSLLVIIVMTLIWWTQYAIEPEMDALLNQPVAADDMTRITSQLMAQGIAYRVSGDRVLVSPDRKFQALAALGYAQVLPRDTKSTFDDMIAKISPFSPAQERDAVFNNIKQQTLAEVIRQFPGVARAMVIIDPTTVASFSNPREASATVSIGMRDGVSASKHLVNAAADLVAGAQSSLSRKRISVIVDGVSWPVRDKEDEGMIGGETILERLQSYERYYTQKIRDQLQFIPGVMPSVTVDLKVETIDKTNVEYARVLSEAKKVRSENVETVGGAGVGSEPGVGANIGAAITAGAAGGGTSTQNKDDSDFEHYPNRMESKIRTPPGTATVVAAAVGVPRSYFVTAFKRLNPNASDPNDAAIKPLIDAELPKIAGFVKACTGLKNDTDVRVDTYPDALPVAAMTAMATASTPTLAAGISGHAKEIALGVLAVASLLMVMTMVRRSGPAAPRLAKAAHAVDGRGPAPHLEVGEGAVGVVGEGDAVLDGMELGDDAVKAQQMLDQVQAMVKENPDGAATLVKRWMNRS